MDVFDDHLESIQSRERYRFYWTKFEDWCKVSTQIECILDHDSDTQQDVVENYMRYLKTNKNPHSIRTMFTPVMLVLKKHPKQRRRFINWDMIKIPKSGKSFFYDSVTIFSNYFTNQLQLTS